MAMIFVLLAYVLLVFRNYYICVCVCEEYGWSHNISFNVTKTMCTAFKPKGTKTCEPCLTLDGNELNFVCKTKYLGVFIENNKTDADVIRQLRKFYA